LVIDCLQVVVRILEATILALNFFYHSITLINRRVLSISSVMKNQDLFYSAIGILKEKG